MGIRETLNDNSKVSTAIVGIVVVALVGLIIWQLTSSGATSVRDTAFPDFYSVDDGQTYFVHSTVELAPFEHEGATAYRAAVFRCNDGEPFVSYIQRYSEEARNRMAQYVAQGDIRYGEGLELIRRDLGPAAIQVKRPGSGDWVSMVSPQGMEIIDGVRCPDGDGATPKMITP